MIEQLKLPEIPRLITAVAEWASCLVFLLPLRKRFSKQFTVFLFLVALMGQCALQLLAGRFSNAFWICGMAMNVAFMLGVIYLIGNMRFNQVVYWCAIAFVSAEFIAALGWQVVCSIFSRVFGVFDIWSWIVSLIVFAVMTALIYFMERRVGSLEKVVGIHQAVTTVILAVIAFSISNISFLNQHWNSSLSQQYSVYFIRTLVDFCVIVIFYLQQWTFRDQQYKEELSSIQNVLNLQYKQYLDFKESSEYISRQCHDLKHQIEALRGACSNEERETYLKEMENAIAMYNGQNVTGNAVLDTLLTRKKIYCLQHDIDFSISADGRSLNFLSVKDICTIMGNILDNAIEYVSNLEDPEERQIQGEIYQKGAFLMIRLENYYHGETEGTLVKEHLPKTTKSDKKRHGFGLKSVRYIVEKYNGSMTLRTENGWFVVRILIPIADYA